MPQCTVLAVSTSGAVRPLPVMKTDQSTTDFIHNGRTSGHFVCHVKSWTGGRLWIHEAWDHSRTREMMPLAPLQSLQSSAFEFFWCACHQQVFPLHWCQKVFSELETTISPSASNISLARLWHKLKVPYMHLRLRVSQTVHSTVSFRVPHIAPIFTSLSGASLAFSCTLQRQVSLSCTLGLFTQNGRSLQKKDIDKCRKVLFT